VRLGPQLLWLTLFATGTAVLPSGEGDDPSQRRNARHADLVEETGATLAQIHVTVTGPRESVSDLGVLDFRLKVHSSWIADFQLDRHCSDPDQAGLDSPSPPAVSYVFYFDQTHLTLPGRQRALDLSRQLVPRLLVDGNQAMIVSNARRLTTVEHLTDSVEQLLAALDRLEHDRTQWDFYATEEPSRVARVVDVLNYDDDVRRAISTARTYQREEHWRADKDLRRLAATLGALSEIDSHKAVVYFADTMRSNPGSHYLSFFGSSVQRGAASLGEMALDVFASSAPIDLLINEATAQGIRLYTVYAQGLVIPVDDVLPELSAATRTGTVSSPSRVRFHDSQNTLADMASETGGHAFLRGAGAGKIAERIRLDRSCMYTLSFDPDGFPLDQPLRVFVDTTRKDVKLQSQGRILLKSASARLVSRLMSAFTTQSRSGDNAGLQAILVPTGFSNGSYQALLQISVSGTVIPSTSWDLGASLLVQDKVLDEVSGTISVQRPGVPLILEREVRLRPGPHEVVAVAHEATTGFVLSDHLQTSWPNPNHQPVTCGPITLLQPTAGAFVRSGEIRTSGSLARSDTDPVRADLPVVLLGLVCGARRHKGLLRVERSLTGGTTVGFPLVEFDLGGERCAQIRDLIPAGSLGPGAYRYDMRVLASGTVLHGASRDFTVEAMTPPPGDS